MRSCWMCSSTLWADGAAPVPSHLPHPLDGCPFPWSKDIWSALASVPNHAAACFCRLWSYQQPKFSLSLRGLPSSNFLQRQLFQKNLPRLYSFPANHIHRTLKFPSVSGLLLFSSFHSTTIMSTHGSLPILLVHFQEQHQHMILQQSSLDHHLSPPPKCLLLLGHPSNLTQCHLQEMTESNSAILHAGI